MQNVPPSNMPGSRPHGQVQSFVLLGGFIGSGRTTAVARLARHCQERGQSMAALLNDRGLSLVDSASLKWRRVRVEEVIGGCLGTQGTRLTSAVQRAGTDLLVAEPAGTCANALHHVRSELGEGYRYAPVSVLVDPFMARTFLCGGSGFRSVYSEWIVALYRQQLEEADLIILNKIDLLTLAERNELAHLLASEFPRSTVLKVSLLTGEGVDGWLERLMMYEAGPTALGGDATVLAQAENRFSWLNCSLQLSSIKGFDAHQVMRFVASIVQGHAEQKGAQLAHLKMFLETEYGPRECVELNQMPGQVKLELSPELPEPVESARLWINVRSECSPDLLNNAVNLALQQAAESIKHLFLRIENLEHFRPQPGLPRHAAA